MAALDCYMKSLQAFPAPGQGAHPHILSVANLGVLAGKDPQVIHDEIRRAIPQGSRVVPDREIRDAINKALHDHQAGTYTPRPRPEPIIKDGKAALQKIISMGKYSEEVDLIEASPVRIQDEPRTHAGLLLDTLYAPDDLLWIGDRPELGIMGDTIRTTAEWIDYFKAGGATAPHIIPNPLDGIPRPKKSGDGETLRGDANVKAFRYCVVEFDELTREDQIRFWSAAKLPIVALIDSGGKSIHAWLEVSKLARVRTLDEWRTHIKAHLYDRIMTPLGVDPACSNPARLSRLPGHFRTEKESTQRILWLSREGQRV